MLAGQVQADKPKTKWTWGSRHVLAEGEGGAVHEMALGRHWADGYLGMETAGKAGSGSEMTGTGTGQAPLHGSSMHQDLLQVQE